MKIIIETLRFTLMFLIFSTILGGISYVTYSILGVSTEKYGWITIIGVFILIYVLYRNRGWGKVYNKTILWASIILIVLLLILIPDVSPSHLHTTKYAYSYGFPFKFLTLYVENGSKFLIPNLSTMEYADWNLNINFLANFLIVYFLLNFSLKYFNK